MLTVNDFEMHPLKPKVVTVPPQTPHPPFPSYYYVTQTPPVIMPQQQGLPAPYFGAPFAHTAMYPVYPVTQYPISSMPPAPLLPQQKYTTSESDLPSYDQLFPPKTTTPAPAKPLTFAEDKGFFKALRPIESAKPAPSKPLDLPNIQNLLAEDSAKAHQQRCKNCCTYYTEENNHDKACFWHPGRFKTPETVRPIMMPVGNLQRWTCCRLSGKDALGCKNTSHVRDEETAEIIDKFAAASARASKSQLSSSAPASSSPLLVDLDFEGSQKEDEAAPSKELLIFQKFHSLTPDLDRREKPSVESNKDETKMNGNVVRHLVNATDTLSGVALKYGAKVSDIRRANNLLSDSVFERKYLDIPNPTRLPDAAELEGVSPKCGREAIAISRFASIAKCDKAEAKFYLVDHGWDMDKALAVFFEDEEWGKSHPRPLKH